MALQQGQIVWTIIDDPAGRNPKTRPAVIVTPTAEIQADQPVSAVAVTGRIEKPIPPRQIALPWHRAGHPQTKLKKPCVVADLDSPS